ncbi:MAG: heme exporter protein CcmB [Candidatus Competibacterales bacterium]
MNDTFDDGANVTEAGLGQAFKAVLVRDVRLGLRRQAEWLNPPLFFVLVVSLFPLGIGPLPQLLATVAPGVIWVAALLATLLPLERLFRADYDDGALDQLLLCPTPLPWLVLAKVAAHWLLTGVPLLLISPLLGLLLHLPQGAVLALPVTLLLGTPTLSLVGAIGGALTVGIPRGGMLLALVILPLYTPVLIFGTVAVDQAAQGLPIAGSLALLGALLALALSAGPLAIAAALRIGVQ